MVDLAEQALHDSLRGTRASLLTRLAGLGEHDVRRPLTPTGTNLLGLVKHLVGVERGYLGECVGRPLPVPLSWYADGSVWDGADMWARADESRAELLERYQEACAHADRTITELDLATPASVPWWPAQRRSTTLAVLLVRVLQDTARHAGQADIVRELVDGRGGDDHDALGDAEHWARYVARIADAAAGFERPVSP